MDTAELRKAIMNKTWVGKRTALTIEQLDDIMQLVGVQITQALIEEINKIFDNPEWQDKSVGQVPTFEILDYLVDRLATLTAISNKADLTSPGS